MSNQNPRQIPLNLTQSCHAVPQALSLPNTTAFEVFILTARYVAIAVLIANPHWVLASDDYACPLVGNPQIRQGDSVARSGGRFDSARSGGKRHGALDLNAALGDPVYAIRDGKAAVSTANWGEMGNTVILDHGDGEYSVYGHLDTLKVPKGATVKKGACIGTVGYSGNASKLKEAGLPPHLHFAIIRAGKSGLADKDKPLSLMREWADYWNGLGIDIVGPVNPGLIMGNTCWKGSTTIGAPGEK